jgi:hypothetical protein
MRQLTMKYAGGGIVRHLGLQNYKGPVPALSELIANAWDADATKVEVTIPLGRHLTPKDEIIVKDNGCGMNFLDCDDKYLVIGRNRRDVEGTDRTPSGRRLMAHKGLGKLAGFGIAKIVEVKTVLDGKLTHFRMSFDDIDKLKQGEAYPPTMIADEESVDLHNGTEVILKDLSLERTIPEDRFFRSMAGRFSIFSDKFKVYLNGTHLKKTRVPLEFRFPEKGDADVTEIDEEGFGSSVLSNGEKIIWWIGFTPDTIKWTEIHGVSVISRGRVAQDPWDFNLAGGTWGQHGLRYMTGEIIAEFVDEGIPFESDTIITNRSGLKWTDPKNEPLYDWGRKKIRELLKTWSERRGKKTLEKVKKEHPELVKKIQSFQPRERKELNTAMRSLAQIPTMKPERLTKLFNHVVDGYRDKVFMDLLQEIIDLPPEERKRTVEILTEFDVFEAIRVHEFVSSHLLVIERFREMIEKGVPEKPDMHDHIRKYPWLLGVKYQPMDYEHSLKRVLDERFDIKVDDKTGRKIPDIVVMRGGTDVLVIELKRPGETVGLEELDQTRNYVFYLREWLDTTNTEGLIGRNITGDDVRGYLLCYDIKSDPLVRRQQDALERDGINVCKWYDVLMKTEDEHREFLDIVKGRAPRDDPRIKELEEKGIA